MNDSNNLRNVPARKLKNAIDFRVRDAAVASPADYLKQFLFVARQYGYATRDDSWGELEKELQIAFRNLERQRRYIDGRIFQIMGGGDKRGYAEIYDDLMDQGEEFWRELQQMKKAVDIFG